MQNTLENAKSAKRDFLIFEIRPNFRLVTRLFFSSFNLFMSHTNCSNHLGGVQGTLEQGPALAAVPRISIVSTLKVDAAKLVLQRQSPTLLTG